jgi:hypothetical protein
VGCRKSHHPWRFVWQPSTYFTSQVTPQFPPFGYPCKISPLPCRRPLAHCRPWTPLPFPCSGGKPKNCRHHRSLGGCPRLVLEVPDVRDRQTFQEMRGSGAYLAPIPIGYRHHRSLGGRPRFALEVLGVRADHRYRRRPIPAMIGAGRDQLQTPQLSGTCGERREGPRPGRETKVPWCL